MKFTLGIAIFDVIIGLYDWVIGIYDLSIGKTLWGSLLIVVGTFLFALAYILFKLYLDQKSLYK
jgi:hypothetical protein